MKKIAVIICLFASFAAAAQRTVRGVVEDETARPLPFAAAGLWQDSTPIAAFQTDENGVFLLSQNKNAAHDSLILRISYVGYAIFEKKIAVFAEGGQANDTLNVGVVQLRPLSNLLSETVVSAARQAVELRGDTTSFAASAYKTQPNAPAEDLLKKIPTVEIERDGTIKAKGETVKQILINGKPFFGTDPKLALQSLSADAIESVEIFEKKSEQALFSGIDDGVREMTVNIVVKPSHNRRTSGKITVGGGNDERYLVRGNYNRFEENKKLTLLIGGNNINRAGFTTEDFTAFTNGGRPANPTSAATIGKGFQAQESGGVNFSENWTTQTDFNASYFFNHQTNQNDRQIWRQNFLPTGSFTTRTVSAGENANKNHRFSSFIDQKLDTFTSFRLTANLSVSDNFGFATSQTDNRRGDTLLQSQGGRGSDTEGSGVGLATNLLLRHRFLKQGRTVSANLNFNLNTADRHGATDAKTDYFSTTTQAFTRRDTLNQTDDRANSRPNYGASLSYTEPLTKAFLLELSYRFSTADNAADRRVFNLHENSEPMFNPTASAAYTSAFASHRTGVTLRFVQKSLTAAVSAQKQWSILRGSFLLKNIEIRQPYDYFLPSARLDFGNGRARRVNFLYETDVREPTIEQLQPVVDNANPFNIYLGNPDLQPERTHRWRVVFTQFNKKTQAFYNANLTASLTDNKIVTALSIDTLLRRTSQPVNIGEQFFDANGAASCGWRFWRQRFRLNLTANGAVSRGVNPINGASNLTERLSASVAPRLEFRLADTFEISARAAIRYNQTRFSLQTTLNQTFWIYEYDGEMSVGLPQDWRINAAFDYSLYVSKSFGATQGVPILTASVSKFFGGRTLEMRLAVIDILNRNTGITRSADANFIQEETVRSLGRYALLTATYSFNRGKSKKEFRTAD